MGRRTRKQKVNAHHPQMFTWKPGQPHVKRESKIEPEAELALTTAKKDILKSLIFASLILGSEVVIYLAWK